jgi:exopolyphosphatase/guanosine-5'-triphosphate,3'-diphosphate pyrophosphatase
MVIYEKTSRFAFHLLHEEKSKVRISENAYMHNHNLQEIPMQRAFNALEDFLSISNSFKSKKTLCVATSALRDAPNKKEFINKVKQKLKLNIKIISGEKEAYFGAVACSNLLPFQTKSLSIDIGGGSTEFSFIDKNNISKLYSLKLGTVRLKELYFDKNDLDGALNYIDKELEFLNNKDINSLIGIGGTFRAISSAIMQNSSYPLNKLHAFTYSSDELKDFISKILSTKDSDELIKLGIDKNRHDVIKPGVFIIQRILNKIYPKEIVTSGVGVREGVYLADLLRTSNDKFPTNYNTSVRYLIDSHISDKTFSNNLNKLSKILFDLTYNFLNIDKKYRYELAVAAKLYPAGSNVHFYSQNKHTYYLIQSAMEYGFTHSSIILIATLTKYAKNKLPSNSHLQKYHILLPNEDITNALSYLLSLSILLLSHRPRNIDFELEFNNGILLVKSDKELYIAKEKVSKLECNNKDFKVVFQ